MKKLFVLLLALILCRLPSYAQIWESCGGRFIEDKTNESYLPYESVQEGIGLNNPTPQPITAEVYGYRILQSNNNDIEYCEDAVRTTPIASETTNDDVVITLGSWESWINEHFTPVMLKSDGTVDYELDRSNQNYKADGITPSDISNVNYDGNAMVKIKKFYISVSLEKKNGDPYDGVGTSYVHIKISDQKIDDTFTCYGFVDSAGNEHDYAYYSMFEGSLDSNNKLRSLKGQTPYLTKTSSTQYLRNVESYAKANGNGWNIDNYALFNALRLAFVMLSANTSMYTVYGYSKTTGSITTGETSDEAGFIFSGTDSSRNKLYKLGWIEEFVGRNWSLINGIYSPSRAVQSSTYIYSFSFKLQEPYNDFSLYTLNTTGGKAKTIQNYGSASTQAVESNLLIPIGDTYSNYAPSNQSNYGGGQVGATAINIPCCVGGSKDTPNNIGMFSLISISANTNVVGTRLTYLEQPSNSNLLGNQSLNNSFSPSLLGNQLQSIEEEEEQINIISTDTMEVDR